MGPCRRRGSRVHIVTRKQLKDLGVVVIGWFGVALIAAKIIGIFTDNLLWRTSPYIGALVICAVYLLSVYRTRRQNRHPEEM